MNTKKKVDILIYTKSNKNCYTSDSRSCILQIHDKHLCVKLEYAYSVAQEKYERVFFYLKIKMKICTRNDK